MNEYIRIELTACQEAEDGNTEALIEIEGAVIFSTFQCQDKQTELIDLANTIERIAAP